VYGQQNAYGQQNMYGQAPSYASSIPPVVSDEVEHIASKALTFGILGMVYPIFVFNILALVNSSKYAKNANGVRSGKAIAGKVLGIVGMVGSGFWLYYWAMMFIAIFSAGYYY